MKPIELTKQIENPHVYWPAKCGFPDGVNSYVEFQIAINWFKENSVTFEYVAFRGESKYYDTFCKPAIARQDKDLTREYTKGHIITDQEVEFVLLNFGDYVGHNIFFHSQHFGSLTRLLDVSKAKEVALYFACNSNFDEDGYLYITYASTMIPMWAPEVKSLEEVFPLMAGRTTSDLEPMGITEMKEINLICRLNPSFKSDQFCQRDL